MTDKPKQIQAIDLVRGLFEHIHGNLGLLKFSVERLEPKNGIPDNPEADKWEAVVSFYKTFSSQQPTKYKAEINIKENTVSIFEIDVKKEEPIEDKKTYRLVKEEDEQ